MWARARVRARARGEPDLAQKVVGERDEAQHGEPAERERHGGGGA